MKKLLLKKQFYMIDNQYKLAENEKQTSLNLLKILSRCLKMYDAQNEILKIINLIESRTEKLRDFKKAQRAEKPSGNDLKKLYVELVRISGRIYAEIRILKSIEKALARPFMFNGKMYDGEHMHLQLKRKRLQILGQVPELIDCSELKMFLSDEGTVGDTRQIAREDTELKEGEALWSSSSEEESDAEDEDGGTNYDTTFNRINETSSMERARTGASRDFQRRTTL